MRKKKTTQKEWNFIVRIGLKWCRTHNEWNCDPMVKLEWYLKRSNKIAISSNPEIMKVVPDKASNPLCVLSEEDNENMNKKILRP